MSARPSVRDRKYSPLPPVRMGSRPVLRFRHRRKGVAAPPGNAAGLRGRAHAIEAVRDAGLLLRRGAGGEHAQLPVHLHRIGVDHRAVEVFRRASGRAPTSRWLWARRQSKRAGGSPALLLVGQCPLVGQCRRLTGTRCCRTLRACWSRRAAGWCAPSNSMGRSDWIHGSFGSMPAWLCQPNARAGARPQRQTRSAAADQETRRRLRRVSRRVAW